PEEVYRTPASRFVASFLGQSNLIAGTIAAMGDGKAKIALGNGATIEAEAPASARKGDKVTVIVRAQRLEVGKATSGPNRLKGKIAATSYLGGSAIYAIEAQGLRLQANTIIESEVFREGDGVDVGFAPSDCVLLGEDDRRLM